VGELKSKLKHAFAIEEPGPTEPTPAQRAPVDWMCDLAARKHMTTPACMALQICRPLNWLVAMTLHFFSPAVWAVAPDRLFRHYRSFAGYLEHRGSIDFMIRRIEQMEADYDEKERQARPKTGGGTGREDGPSETGREDLREEA
jgi:hypothetical protein